MPGTSWEHWGSNSQRDEKSAHSWSSWASEEGWHQLRHMSKMLSDDDKYQEDNWAGDIIENDRPGEGTKAEVFRWDREAPAKKVTSELRFKGGKEPAMWTRNISSGKDKLLRQETSLIYLRNKRKTSGPKVKSRKRVGDIGLEKPCQWPLCTPEEGKTQGLNELPKVTQLMIAMVHSRNCFPPISRIFYTILICLPWGVGLLFDDLTDF